jgi:uncharacterized RDD family membrane protein YckC
MSQPVADAPSLPVAELDRRFYAYALDRLVAWTLDALVVVAAYQLLISRGHPWAGVAVVLAAALLVGLGFALLLGARGTSPGKAALGLRVVRHDTGNPVGVGPAVLRSLVLGVAALPTFGLGVATLAWTAVMDRGRQRRGWHDHLAHSIVVDVRPVEVLPEVVEAVPRQIVNLTAMRLVPTPQPVAVATPPRPAAPPGTPVVPAPPLEPGPPPVAAPVAPPPTRAQGAPSTSAPPATAGRTVVRDGRDDTAGRRVLARWRVSFDSGESFLVEGLALVGRRPEPRPGEPVRHLVPLRSGDMSLSKTHAQFQVAPDGVLVVMDRGSTNGSILIRRGVSRELAAGRPATLLDGDRIRFGDREMQVSREE